MDVAEDYMQALLALFPLGPAWPKDPNAPAALLFQGLSAEFSRLDGRADVLLDECDPRTTYELLPDWERIAGLSAGSFTLAERRANLYSRLTNRGGQSRADFIALGASLGLSVTITEFNEWTFDMDDDETWYGVDWAFAWQVNIAASLAPSVEWTFDSDDDEPFAVYPNAVDVSAFIADKPAHTNVLFAYN